MKGIEALNTIITDRKRLGIEFGKEAIVISKELVEKESLERYLLKWKELLSKDLMNSKKIVLEDIKSLIKKYNLEEDL